MNIFPQCFNPLPAIDKRAKSQPRVNKPNSFFLLCCQQQLRLFGAVVILCLCHLSNAQTVPSGITPGDCCHLKILTWNIQMMPRMAITCKGKQQRADAIVKKLQDNDYDIIVFQEVFDQRAFARLYKGLKQQFPYQTGMPLKKNFLFASNGLYIISKIPFKVMDYVFFDDASGMDFFSNKGALLIEAEKNEKVFQLVGTHLQASDKPKDVWIRAGQYKQIEDSLLKPYARPGIPQFIAGDMNTPNSDLVQYKNMLTTFVSEDDSLSGDVKSTYDGLHNQMVIKSDRRLSRQIDYILIRNVSASLISPQRRVVKFQFPWNKKYSDLSDHYALEGVFEL